MLPSWGVAGKTRPLALGLTGLGAALALLLGKEVFCSWLRVWADIQPVCAGPAAAPIHILNYLYTGWKTDSA